MLESSDINRLESHQYEIKQLTGMGFTEVEIKKIWKVREKRTPKGAAAELRRILLAHAHRTGCSRPESEVSDLRNPKEQARYTMRAWAAMWESGPYDWGSIVSFLLAGAKYWIAEPYYSFDVHFFPLKPVE